MTKMKHFFQKYWWQPASSQKSKDSTPSLQLLISFISGRSLMQNDRGKRVNIPITPKIQIVQI